MYVEIEPTGCSERNGMVQVRLSMYLEKKDYKHSEHYVQCRDDKDKEVMRNNPFHNHFIQVEPGTSEKEILDIAEAFLHEAGMLWCMDNEVYLANHALPFQRAVKIDGVRRMICQKHVEAVKKMKGRRYIK